ncbi:hypothetical protein KIPB_003409 [Kipferlia bialata]|uniref:IQ motif, EF-hand binding site n=1 Tax=Kipferlia bialata TaxID=797122 RepID=A0A9K3CS49_9EUKA|nr:hypothetical protein KIPB_001463 [Kipferlia bialata]GIQ82299.1 hypothetical protein KIPB_003409 [Kipferlia bialata]|eukprot:g1463.t1
MQSFVRQCKLAQDTFKRLQASATAKRRTSAAITIQSYARTYLAKKRVQRMRDAAQYIQRVWRGTYAFLGYRSLVQTKNISRSILSDCIHNAVFSTGERDEAVLRIQRVWRGYRVRCLIAAAKAGQEFLGGPIDAEGIVNLVNPSPPFMSHAITSRIIQALLTDADKQMLVDARVESTNPVSLAQVMPDRDKQVSSAQPRIRHGSKERPTSAGSARKFDYATRIQAAWRGYAAKKWFNESLRRKYLKQLGVDTDENGAIIDPYVKVTTGIFGQTREQWAKEQLKKAQRATSARSKYYIALPNGCLAGKYRHKGDARANAASPDLDVVAEEYYDRMADNAANSLAQLATSLNVHVSELVTGPKDDNSRMVMQSRMLSRHPLVESILPATSADTTLAQYYIESTPLELPPVPSHKRADRESAQITKALREKETLRKRRHQEWQSDVFIPGYDHSLAGTVYRIRRTEFDRVQAKHAESLAREMSFTRSKHRQSLMEEYNQQGRSSMSSRGGMSRQSGATSVMSQLRRLDSMTPSSDMDGPLPVQRQSSRPAPMRPSRMSTTSYPEEGYAEQEARRRLKEELRVDRDGWDTEGPAAASVKRSEEKAAEAQPDPFGFSRPPNTLDPFQAMEERERVRTPRLPSRDVQTRPARPSAPTQERVSGWPEGEDRVPERPIASREDGYVRPARPTSDVFKFDKVEDTSDDESSLADPFAREASATRRDPFSSSEVPAPAARRDPFASDPFADGPPLIDPFSAKTPPAPSPSAFSFGGDAAPGAPSRPAASSEAADTGVFSFGDAAPAPKVEEDKGTPFFFDSVQPAPKAPLPPREPRPPREAPKGVVRRRSSLAASETYKPAYGAPRSKLSGRTSRPSSDREDNGRESGMEGSSAWESSDDRASDYEAVSDAVSRTESVPWRSQLGMPQPPTLLHVTHSERELRRQAISETERLKSRGPRPVMMTSPTSLARGSESSALRSREGSAPSLQHQYPTSRVQLAFREEMSSDDDYTVE